MLLKGNCVDVAPIRKQKSSVNRKVDLIYVCIVHCVQAQTLVIFNLSIIKLFKCYVIKNHLRCEGVVYTSGDNLLKLSMPKAVFIIMILTISSLATVLNLLLSFLSEVFLTLLRINELHVLIAKYLILCIHWKKLPSHIDRGKYIQQWKVINKPLIK